MSPLLRSSSLALLALVSLASTSLAAHAAELAPYNTWSGKDLVEAFAGGISIRAVGLISEGGEFRHAIVGFTVVRNSIQDGEIREQWFSLEGGKPSFDPEIGVSRD